MSERIRIIKDTDLDEREDFEGTNVISLAKYQSNQKKDETTVLDYEKLKKQIEQMELNLLDAINKRDQDETPVSETEYRQQSYDTFKRYNKYEVFKNEVNKMLTTDYFKIESIFKYAEIGVMVIVGFLIGIFVSGRTGITLIGTIISIFACVVAYLYLENRKQFWLEKIL